MLSRIILKRSRAVDSATTWLIARTCATGKPPLAARNSRSITPISCIGSTLARIAHFKGRPDLMNLDTSSVNWAIGKDMLAPQVGFEPTSIHFATSRGMRCRFISVVYMLHVAPRHATNSCEVTRKRHGNTRLQPSPEQDTVNNSENLLCVSISANSSRAHWTFEAGCGCRARAAWKRLALLSPVETIRRHLLISAAPRSSVL